VIFHSKSSQLRPCRHVEACRFPLQVSVLLKSTCSTSLEHLVYGSSPSSLNSHFGFQHRYATLPSRPIEPFPVNNPRDQWTNSSSQKSTATAAERLTKTLVDKIAEGIDSHEVFDNDIILLIPEEAVGGYVDLVSHLWDIAKLEARNGKRQAWKFRFLAGCLYLAAPSLPSRSNEISSMSDARTTLRCRCKIASLINSIVAGLQTTWGSRAEYVYEAVVGRLQNIVGRLQTVERQAPWHPPRAPTTPPQPRRRPFFASLPCLRCLFALLALPAGLSSFVWRIIESVK
jgi:hypothetical protein